MVVDRNGLGRVALLSGIAYLGLSTLSVSEECQRPHRASCCLTTPAERATRSGRATIGSALTCEASSEEKLGRCQTTRIPSAMRGANFVWDEENLERFIANPDETVPGNTMKPYGGLASAESRVKLIAFLKTLTADQ